MPVKTRMNDNYSQNATLTLNVVKMQFDVKRRYTTKTAVTFRDIIRFQLLM